MAAIDPTVAVRVSTDAAQNFIESYYPVLNSRRDTISSFYMSPANMPGGMSLPLIFFNGNQIPDAAAMQAMYQQQMPESRYEVQSYDCQVVNPSYISEGTQGFPAGTGRNMTILVAVSGYVKYGTSRDAKARGFSESFVLMPNPAAATSRQRRQDLREWLIQTQHFRIVV